MASDDDSIRQSESASLSSREALLSGRFALKSAMRQQPSFQPDTSELSAHGGSLNRASGSGSGRGCQPEIGSVPRGGAFRSAVRDLKQEARGAAVGSSSEERSVHGGSANRSYANLYAELTDAEAASADERLSLRRASSTAHTDDGVALLLLDCRAQGHHMLYHAKPRWSGVVCIMW